MQKEKRVYSFPYTLFFFLFSTHPVGTLIVCETWLLLRKSKLTRKETVHHSEQV